MYAIGTDFSCRIEPNNRLSLGGTITRSCLFQRLEVDLIIIFVVITFYLPYGIPLLTTVILNKTFMRICIAR